MTWWKILCQEVAAKNQKLEYLWYELVLLWGFHKYYNDSIVTFLNIHRFLVYKLVNPMYFTRIHD